MRRFTFSCAGADIPAVPTRHTGMALPTPARSQNHGLLVGFTAPERSRLKILKAWLSTCRKKGQTTMRKINARRNWLMHQVPGGLLGRTARLGTPAQGTLLGLLAAAAVLAQLL